MKKRDLLSVWNKEKVSDKKTNTLPVEVQRNLYAKAKELRGKGYSYPKIAEELGYFGHSTVWDWLNTEREPPGKQVKVINFTPRENLSRFFGCLEGSSYIGSIEKVGRNNSHKYLMRAIREDKNEAKQVQKIVKSLLDKDIPIRKIKEDPILYLVEISSKHLVEFWNGYEGVSNHYGRPEFIETLEKYPEHFLSGVFDTRGFLCYNTNVIKKTKMNEKSINLISDCLDRLDIEYLRRARTRDEAEQIIIPRRGLNRFLEVIPLENKNRVKNIKRLIKGK